MTNTEQREVWQRGPVAGVPPLLQPVAHALLQAREEVEKEMQGFPDKLLWERPAGVASVAFHMQHLTGVLDRLFTYALEKALTEEQLKQLSLEGKEDPALSGPLLTKAFQEQVEKALQQIRATDESTLLEARGIGRAQIPTNVIGLLVHAAEHTQRHVGQLLVTARILKAR